MKIKQISIFLENKAGRLAEITSVLGEADVNLLALSLADTADFGILRLIVNDVDRAEEALKAGGIVWVTNQVTAVEVADEPGGLAKILGLLVEAGVNVEYMYAFSERQTGRAALIFRFDDADKAVACLQGAGINVFKQMDLT